MNGPLASTISAVRLKTRPHDPNRRVRDPPSTVYLVKGKEERENLLVFLLHGNDQQEKMRMKIGNYF